MRQDCRGRKIVLHERIGGCHVDDVAYTGIVSDARSFAAHT